MRKSILYLQQSYKLNARVLFFSATRCQNFSLQGIKGKPTTENDDAPPLFPEFILKPRTSLPVGPSQT